VQYLGTIFRPWRVTSPLKPLQERSAPPLTAHHRMAKLQPELYSFFRDLPQNGRITAEYIWVGGNGPLDIRSKTRCLDSVPGSVSDLPEWNYDGSSTNQAPGQDSEVLLIPRAIFKDPFRGGANILVVADTYSPADRAPLPSNSRAEASRIFESVQDQEMWFGIEQEYTLFQGGRPLGWPSSASKSFAGPCIQIGYTAPSPPRAFVALFPPRALTTLFPPRALVTPHAATPRHRVLTTALWVRTCPSGAKWWRRISSSASPPGSPSAA
jgi:hypothetical protein